uniref:Uncharacterized protein n=1 Tax=Arundo donax TaxID=35708 RepID=A0A0A8YG04_ARUDO
MQSWIILKPLTQHPICPVFSILNRIVRHDSIAEPIDQHRGSKDIRPDPLTFHLHALSMMPCRQSPCAGVLYMKQSVDTLPQASAGT